MYHPGFRPARGRPGDELPDECKLYVGNLPHELGEDDLRAAFAPFGTVLHAAIIKARPDPCRL